MNHSLWGNYKQEGLGWGPCWAPETGTEMGHSVCQCARSTGSGAEVDVNITFPWDMHESLEAGALICYRLYEYGST